MRRLAAPATIITCSILIAACGSATVATYDDPNSDGVAATSIESLPISRFGADTIERGIAIARMRSHAIVLKQLAGMPGEPPSAIASEAGALGAADRHSVTGAVALRSPQSAERLDFALRDLADRAAAAGASLPGEVDRVGLARSAELADRLLAQAQESSVGRSAWNSPGWRAALVASIISDEMFSAFETAYIEDPGLLTSASSYRLAWGLLQVLSDDPTGGSSLIGGLDARTRPLAQRMLEKARRDLLTTIKPTAAPDDVEAAASSIADIADAISGTAQVDVTLPSPTQKTESSLQRARAELEAMQAGSGNAAVDQHLQAARAAYMEAAPGIAAVDTMTLGSLDHAIGVLVPSTIPGSPLSMAADDVPIDQRIASAIEAVDAALTSVRDELEALREDG